MEKNEFNDNQMPIIIARDVHKWFGDFHALKGIDLEVQKGEVVVIFGPSGSGKSTFIRTINRLEEHQQDRAAAEGVRKRIGVAVDARKGEVRRSGSRFDGHGDALLWPMTVAAHDTGSGDMVP